MCPCYITIQTPPPQQCPLPAFCPYSLLFSFFHTITLQVWFGLVWVLLLAFSLVSSGHGAEEGMAAGAGAGAGVPGSSRGVGRAAAAVLQCHLQLRRLILRHGQLRHHKLRQAAQHAQVPAAVREVLQRPPRHRLPGRGVRSSSPPSVGEQGHQLQPGRQLRGDGRDGAGPQVLQGQQRVEHPALQHLHERAAGVVPGGEAHHLLVSRGLPRPLRQGPVRVRRVRRQRLQLRVEGGLVAGEGEDDGARRGGLAGERRGAAAGRGRPPRRGAGEPPRRLHPHHAHHVPVRGPVRVRPAHRVPQEVQQRRALPQRHAPHRARPAPAPAAGGAHRLRRLLHALHPVRANAAPLRLQARRSACVLRRRRPVQLQHERVVRPPRRHHLRRPGRARQLGRHPPHGGALPLHRQHLGQGALRASAARHRRPRGHGRLIAIHRCMPASASIPFPCCRIGLVGWEKGREES